MCGRYSIVRGDRIVGVVANVTMPANLRLVARYNAAPTQMLPVIAGGAGAGGDAREVQMMKWGLVPSWAKEESIGNRLINARAETLLEKPAFRTALQRRRCLVPADGFYEWRKNSNGTKTPMYIRRKDGNVFAFAGLWDTWQSPAGDVLKTFTIITTSPNALMQPIHNRMPVVLSGAACEEWLAHGGTELLRPAEDDLQTQAVRPLVNKPGNEGPELIEAVAEGEAVSEAERGGAEAGGEKAEAGEGNGAAGGRRPRKGKGQVPEGPGLFD